MLRRRLFATALATAILLAGRATAAVYYADPGALNDGNLYVDIPNDIGNIRGVYVVGKRGDMDTAFWAPRTNDWQPFLNSFGFVMAYRTQGEASCPDERDVPQMTMAALTDIAAQSGHPELAYAPVFIFGFSGDAAGPAAMPEVYPNRTLGGVWHSTAYSCSYGNPETQTNEIFHTPTMEINCALDGWGWQLIHMWTTMSNYAGYVITGSVAWTHVQQGGAHGAGMNRTTVQFPWILAVAGQRLPSDTAPYTNLPTLSRLNTNYLWRGDQGNRGLFWTGSYWSSYDSNGQSRTVGSFKIWPATNANPPGISTCPTMSALPDEAYARVWQAYSDMTNAAVSPSGNDAALAIQTVGLMPMETRGSEESGRKLRFAVVRTRKTPSPLHVGFTVSGTASNGVDYAAVTNLICTIPGNEWAGYIEIDPLDDTVTEGTETVVVTLQPNTNSFYLHSPSFIAASLREDETAAPVITALTPANDTDDFIETNLVMTFSRKMAKGTGLLTLTNLTDGTLVEAIDVSSARVTVSGNHVTIALTNYLAGPNLYAITIAPTALKDTQDHPFAGISDTTTWRFTALAYETDPPQLVSTLPANGSTNFNRFEALSLTFNEAVQAAGGLITISNLTLARNVERINVTDSSRVTINSSNILIQPSNPLAAGHEYCVRIEPGAITDLFPPAPNPFAGFTNNTAWRFFTKPDPGAFTETFNTENAVSDPTFTTNLWGAFAGVSNVQYSWYKIFSATGSGCRLINGNGVVLESPNGGASHIATEFLPSIGSLAFELLRAIPTNTDTARVRVNIVTRNGATNQLINYYDYVAPGTNTVTASAVPVNQPVKIEILKLNGDLETTLDNLSWSPHAFSDTNPPSPAFVPGTGSIELPTTQVFVVRFDEDILAADGSPMNDALAQSSFSLTNILTGSAVPFTAVYDYEFGLPQVTLTPAAPLEPFTSYMLALKPAAIRDLGGNTNSAGARALLTTAPTNRYIRETFRNNNASTNTNPNLWGGGTFVGDEGFPWTFHSVGSAGYLAGAYRLDAEGMILRGSGSNSMITAVNVPGGVGSFMVVFRNGDGTASARKLALDVAGQHYESVSADSADATLFRVDNINAAGNENTYNTIILSNTTTKMTTIDSILWTTYRDPLEVLASTGSLSVAEGGTAAVTLTLNRYPDRATTVAVQRVSGSTNVTTATGSLILGEANWNTGVAVTFAADEDPDVLNDAAAFRFSGPDVLAATVVVTQADNDVGPEVSTTNLIVREGTTNSLQIRLTQSPAATTTVTVSRVSGDTDLAVAGTTSFVFTTSDGSTWQTARISAATDADSTDGSASFSVASAGVTPVLVTATERDSAWTNWIAFHDMHPTNNGDAATTTLGFTHGEPHTLTNALTGEAADGATLTLRYFDRLGAEKAASVSLDNSAVANPANGTHAATLFTNNLKPSAVYKLALTTDYATVTINGLSPDRRYGIGLFVNRGTFAPRTRFTLLDATNFTAAGSAGIGDCGDGDPATYEVEVNNSTRGYVAMWTNITPTGNGGTSFTVKQDHWPQTTGSTFRIAQAIWITGEMPPTITNPPPAITNTLTVVSAYGQSAPAAGIHSYANGSVIACAITNTPLTQDATTQVVASGWSMTGNNPLSGSGTNVTLTLTNNATLTWRWETNVLLQAAAEVHGTVSTTGGWYRSISNVVITATPNAGHAFAGWSGDVAPAGTNDNPLTLPMTGPRSVTAHFLTNAAPNYSSNVWMVLDEFPAGTTYTNLMIPMRDGIRLSTHVFLPAGSAVTSFPVVLVRSAYNEWSARASYANDVVNQTNPTNFTWINTNGYVYVFQDLRGDGESDINAGFEPRLSDNEIHDTYDTIEALATNAWSNGRVGMYGSSGHGMAAYMGWLSKAPHLVVAAPGNTAPNLYEHWSFENGARRWIYQWLQFRNADGAVMPTWPKPTLGTYYTNAAWPRILREGAAGNPAVLQASDAWHNYFLDSTFETFGALASTQKAYLIMDHGTHQGDIGLTFTPKPSGFFNPPTVFQILDGVPFTNTATLKHFVMGDARRTNSLGNFYRLASSWPPPAVSTPFYLHADGALSTSLPTSSAASLSYTYHPTNPVPSVGGNFSYGTNAATVSGPLNQLDARLTNRTDILRFETAPFAVATEISGRLQARLFVSTDVADTLFTVKLIDIYPAEGTNAEYHAIMRESAIMGRYWSGFASPSPMSSGQVYRLDIDLSSISLLVETNHRLAVHISSSSDPAFEVHPNTYTQVSSYAGSPTAHNTLYLNTQYPSMLRLPLLATNVPAVVLSTSLLSVTEGDTATFTVRLDRAPASPVTASVARISGDTDLDVDTGANLVFAPGNWSVPQQVTLSAVQDADGIDALADFEIAGPAVAAALLQAQESDDDPWILITPSERLVPEGGTATVGIILSRAPVTPVTVTVSRVSGDGDLTISGPTSFVFTAGSWNATQNVAIASAPDADSVWGTALFRFSSDRAFAADVTAREADDEPVLLRVDFGLTNSVVESNGSWLAFGASATAESSPASRTYAVGPSNLVVTVSSSGTLQGKDRSNPAANNGALTYAGVYRDLLQTSVGTITLSVTGLTPSSPYALRGWVYDYSFNDNAIFSVTNATDGGALLLGQVTNRTGAGGVPTNDSMYAWSGSVTSSAGGTLVLTLSGTVSARINGLELAEAGGTPPPTFTLAAAADNAGWGSVSPTGGSYAAGTVVQITATASNGCSFVNWSGDASGSANPLSLTIDANKSVTANFITNAPPTVTNTLTVISSYGTPSPSGTTPYTNGAIVSTSVGGSPVDQGTTQIVATGWTMNGNSPTSGSAANFSLTLTNNATLTWLWQTNVLLQASAGSGGSVSSTGGWYALGASVTVTATPDSGFSFTGWSGDVSGATNANPLTLTMDRARAVAADFATNAPPVSDALIWRVDFNGSGNDTLATSNFTGWTVSTTSRTQSFANIDGGAVSSSITVRLLGSGTYSAYQRTMSAGSATNLYRDGAQMSVSPFTLSVTNLTPGASYELRLWYFDDDFQQGIAQTYQNTTDGGAVGLGALTNTPNASAAAGHATLPTGLYDPRYCLFAAVNAGTDGEIRVAITPTSGNGRINAFELAEAGGTPPPTFTLVAAANNASWGSVSPTGGSYAAGSLVQITATASNGFSFVNWSGDASGSANPLALTIDANKSVTAIFLTNAPPTVTNTLTVISSYGTPSPSGTTPYTNGSVVSVSVGASPVVQGTTQIVATGWAMSGNSPTSGSAANFALTLTNTATLTWLWQTNVLLQATAGSGGSLGSTGGWFALGGSVTVTATPDSGFSFTGWSGDVSGATNANPLTLTMDRARAVAANFVTNAPPAGDALIWRVDFNGSDGDTLAPSNFTGWIVSTSSRTQIVANVDGGPLSSSVTVRLLGGGTFSAFQRSMNSGAATNLYRDGAQTTVSPITLSVTGLTAGASYNLRVWYFDDDFQQGITQTYVNVTDGGSVALGALTNTPNVSAAAGHATLPTGLYDSRYSLGAAVTAGSGGEIRVSIASSSGNAKINAFELTAPDGAPPVVTYTLVVASTHGMASPAGTNAYPSGAQVMCAITNSPLESGFATQRIAVGWTGTGSVPASGAGTSVTFTIGTASTLTWLWQTNHLLQAVAGANGSVSTTGGWYRSTSNAILSATPASGYVFAGWTGAVASLDNPLTLAMDGGKTVWATFTESGPTNPVAPLLARNVRLVDFGAKLGSGYYRGQSAARSYPALHDEDNNGTLTNDSVRAWIFSTNLALNAPGLEYDTNSPSGVFYGGITTFAVNNPNRSLSEGLLNQNHEFMDDANVMGLGDIIPGELFSTYAVFFWQKRDFLNGGDESTVRFDTNSTITAHISRYWGGVNAGRWLVREGDQFYLSQATFAGRTNQYDLTTTNRVDDPGHGAENPVTRRSHTLRPHTSLWAPYNPGGAPGTNDDYEIGFNSDTATYSAITFTNVTAVGFFIERRLSEPKLVWTGLLPNQPMGVKWNAFQCNAVVERPDTPSHYVPTTPVLGGDTFLGSNSVPYELWRRTFRHMVRRQYPRSLGALTYSLERDGAMGTMRVDDLAHAGNEPVREITWLDAIAFCNGLSEIEGREPCYYSDTTLTNVLRIVLDRDNIETWTNRPTVYWKTSADGFRLATIAEWDNMPVGLRETNCWEYVWHLSGTVAEPSAHTSRTVRGWSLIAPTGAVGRFTERPWNGSPRIGFRVALNGTNLPNPAAASGAAATWTFHTGTALEPASAPSLAALRAEVTLLCAFTNLAAGLAQPTHSADTNFNPGAVIAGAPYALDIAKTEVPFRLWNLVQGWARDNGYRFNYDGDLGSMGNAPGSTLHTNSEPVTQLSLYDAYAWCNAMSELMGRPPVYFYDETLTQPYRHANLFRLETLKAEDSPNWPNGSVVPYDTASLIPVFMNVTSTGYRLLLPQEWALVNITNSLTPDPAYNWLLGNANGKTQPVGTLLPNPLGLHDMNGNVLELTWGSTKATLVGGNIPLRQGSHFARGYRNNSAKSPDWGEFAGVGRCHVGFRIAALPGVADSDGDGFADDIDNCPATWNADQRDTNNDGVGDACEPNNSAPVLAVPDSVTVLAGQMMQSSTTASDPDGTLPDVSVGSVPAGLITGSSIQGTNRQVTLTWTPSTLDYGVHLVPLAAGDGIHTARASALIYVGLPGESTNTSRGLPASLVAWSPVSEVAASATGSSTVRWSSVQGAVYRVYGSSGAVGTNISWQLLATLTAGGSVSEFVDTTAPATGHRTYQIAVDTRPPTLAGAWGTTRTMLPATQLSLYAVPSASDRRVDGDCGAQLAAMLTGSANKSAADKILVLDGGAWRVLWLDELGRWREESNNQLSAYSIPSGLGFYVERPSYPARIVVQHGPIGNVGTNTTAIRTGWNLLGLSEGRHLPVGEIFATASPVGGATEETGDVIYVLNETGGWRRLLYVEGWGAPHDGQWVDLDSYTIATTNLIAPAQGLFYRRIGAPTEVSF